MTQMLKFVKELELELDALMQPIALLGNRGGGKTYAGQALFEEAYRHGVQCIAIEGIGKWWALRLGKDGHAKGLENVFVFGGKRGDFPLTPDKGAFVAKVLVEKRVSAVLDVSLMRKGDRRRFVTDFAEEFYLLKKQQDVADPCVMFLEEAHQFIPQKPQPDEARMLGAFEDIVSEGRNAGLGVVVMDQRPARANKNVLALVELLVVLRTTYKSDRDVYADWIVQRDAGVADKVDLHKTLPFLKAGQGFLYAPLFDQFGRVTVLPKQTFDASATAKVGVAVKQIGTLTPVDVAQLNDAMAAVVAEAEQKNPELLKRRIRQLEAELAAKPKALPPCNHQLVLRRLQRLHSNMQEAAIELAAAQGELAPGAPAAPLPAMREALTASVPGALQLNPPVITVKDPVAMERVTKAAIASQDRVNGEPVTLHKGAREMLREIVALHGRHRLARRQLGTRAVMTPSGGAVGNYIRDLKNAGLIVEAEGELGFDPTPAGIRTANGATPKGRAELVALWMPQFDRGARKMFEALVEKDGEPMTREELAAAAGMDPGGGAVGNYIRDLVRAGVAENPAKGKWHLSPALSLGED